MSNKKIYKTVLFAIILTAGYFIVDSIRMHTSKGIANDFADIPLINQTDAVALFKQIEWKDKIQYKATFFAPGGPTTNCWLFSKIDEKAYLAFWEQFEQQESLNLYGPKPIYGSSFLEQWQHFSEPLNIGEPSGNDGLAAAAYFRIGHKHTVIKSMYDIPTEKAVFQINIRSR